MAYFAWIDGIGNADSRNLALFDGLWDLRRSLNSGFRILLFFSHAARPGLRREEKLQKTETARSLFRYRRRFRSSESCPTSNEYPQIGAGKYRISP